MEASVSIIIPCFNAEPFLREAIQSALDQTHSAQVIVINDGSTDGSLAIAQSFAGVTVLSQPNAGVGVARNRGVAEATGDFILFLDADDRLWPEAVARHLQAFAEHGDAPMVYGCNRLIDETGARIGENLQARGRVTWREVLFGAVPTPTQSMFRRIALQRVGGFDPLIHYGEDYDLYLRLGQLGNAVCHGCIVADYRKHSGQATGRPAAALESIVGVVEKRRRTVGGGDRIWKQARYRWRLYYGRWIPVEIVRALLRRDCSRARHAAEVYLRHMPHTALGFAFEVLDKRWRARSLASKPAGGGSPA